MVDPLVFLPSAFLGLILAGWYVWQVVRNGRDFDGNRLFIVFFYATGVVIGFYLILTNIFPRLPIQLGRGADIYVIFGGVAVLIFSGRGVYRDLYDWEPEDS